MGEDNDLAKLMAEIRDFDEHGRNELTEEKQLGKFLGYHGHWLKKMQNIYSS
jgi:hypothetical protein